jgi:hypothetical protein
LSVFKSFFVRRFTDEQTAEKELGLFVTELVTATSAFQCCVEANFAATTRATLRTCKSRDVKPATSLCLIPTVWIHTDG